MNSETGEIRKFSKGQARPVAFDLQLTPAEAEILELVEPAMRVTIYQNWRDKEMRTRYSNVIEKTRAKLHFLEGCVVGIHLAADQKAVDKHAESETIEAPRT